MLLAYRAFASRMGNSGELARCRRVAMVVGAARMFVGQEKSVYLGRKAQVG